ncbi:DinB family protein [Asanoa sp. WMMD1127]|uniref:DinB family protein n=1 Tax=Asanoa sp. WMMD1127 TaxID=3016107 RepID=UPI0024173857|nr:DinB family protein [Asanoa sp. WMMD1127]MDG4824451.1 DinB family protein [Asanoa sp. WMMD1127]
MTERADLLASLQRHRGFLLFTVGGLTDEQARLTPTASALCLGGLLRHVATIERSWSAFAAGGAEGMASVEVDWVTGFQMPPGATLADLVADFEAAAAETDALVEKLDLDTAHPLPTAPWFEPGASWTVRRVFLHLIAEISQHSGHADILRETIDGQKTMG